MFDCGHKAQYMSGQREKFVIVVWRFLHGSNGSDVLATKQALFFIVLFQYIPRFLRVIPLTSEMKRTTGVFAETAWAGAAYYLLLYMLCSHIVGAFWYWVAVERNDTCWQKACKDIGRDKCNTNFLYCGNQHMEGYGVWNNTKDTVLKEKCPADDNIDNPPFDFGIFTHALSSGIVSSTKFFSKYCYCLWWGLQNLSLAVTATTLRTIIDAFYLIRMALQFRTAYIAPSSRVFGRGELVIDPARIAKRYMLQYFFLDFLAVLPLPQVLTVVSFSIQ
ncbi:hypothetical protein GOBAR_DD31285 [Gossypium barbadense]|nr:hypothetical protein GOBAR_DD31285 [Gossypium barbadense]